MKSFLGILVITCWLRTGYGLKLPTVTVSEWTDGNPVGYNSKYFVSLAKDTDPSNEIDKLPAILASVMNVVSHDVNWLEGLFQGITQDATSTFQKEESTSNAKRYFYLPNNQVLPYISAFPAMTKALNKILSGERDFQTNFKNPIGSVIALPLSNGIQTSLTQIAENIGKFTSLLEAAELNSTNAQGPDITLMTYLNYGIQQEIPNLELLQKTIKNCLYALQFSSNSQNSELVNVHFGNAIEILNGYISQDRPIVQQLEKTANLLWAMCSIAFFAYRPIQR